MAELMNLETYILTLQGDNESGEILNLIAPPTEQGELSELVNQLMSSPRLSLGKRKRLILKMLENLMACSYIPKIEVFYPVFSKKRAFMSDKGYLSISCGFLLMCQGARLCKVLLHEIGHLHLLGKEWYCDLLTLDREFRGAYGDRNGMLALSPAEYLATYSSILLMEYVKSAICDENVKVALTREIEAERFKLADAKAQFFVENFNL